VYLQTGDIRQALADFVLAREDNPENATAWLGEFEAALALDDKDVARAALDEFTKLRPNDKRIASLRDRLE
jgi:Flp pilus assembly protein TadD